MKDLERTRSLIEQAFADRDRVDDPETVQAIHSAIEALDEGKVRVAEFNEQSDAWETQAWLKQAVLLYFTVQQMKRIEVGPFEYWDKIPLKKDLERQGVRVVPPGTARFGSHLERGAVLMPGYVNIGARVGAGSMVDTWATVGSCAQVGNGVHLSGGVGLGGVLEPPTASPVIIEDGVFVGSRAIVVEGVRVRREAVLGANVVLTASTRIVDVTKDSPVEMRGEIPKRAVVIPGARTKRFPAGEYQVPCALIVGYRSERTDKKVSLNDALREFAVQV